jgi:hypothetical protein
MRFVVWHLTIGMARYDGVQAELTEPPTAVADDIRELVYFPGLVNIIRVGEEPLRQMVKEEGEAAHRILVQMASDARDALVGGSTLVVVMK